MNVVYLVFGSELKNHVQTYFSLLTFSKAQKINSINVITDKPEFYKQVAPRVNIISITEAQINEWKGEYDFFWRIKIKAIELIADLYNGENILYLDSDTFLSADNLEEISELLAGGKSLMHLNEGRLCDLNTKTEKRMWNQTRNKTFGGVQINEQSCMWNAGVICIPGNKSKQLIELTLNICDDMLKANVTRRLIEQFSFSVSLSSATNLTAASNFIGHYWGNKQDWNIFATQFLLESYFQNSSFEKQVSDLREFDFSTIPVYVKESNTKKRIIKLLNRIFEKNNKIYIR